ncbi:hypothetical protein GCM10009821_27570 [Aeromicrobium halocynthiae]|uniref:Uncharacterized protein n=2 Tax=Aeromicrobium halocynthiae TaxID=560557 RepID=A0ABN2W604_9ACTN
MAEIVLNDRVVGYLATQVVALSTELGGRWWWKKWSEPWEVIEWLMTRTNDDAPLPEFDDGIDDEGQSTEELQNDLFTYPDQRASGPIRPLVIYSLRWLNADDVNVLWDRYGFSDTTLL